MKYVGMDGLSREFMFYRSLQVTVPLSVLRVHLQRSVRRLVTRHLGTPLILVN